MEISKKKELIANELNSLSQKILKKSNDFDSFFSEFAITKAIFKLQQKYPTEEFLYQIDYSKIKGPFIPIFKYKFKTKIKFFIDDQDSFFVEEVVVLTKGISPKILKIYYR